MNKVYNTQEEIATNLKNFLLDTNLKNFLLDCFKNIRKTQFKIIPYIVIGMILAESVVASDIAKNLKGDFSLVQHDSVIRRIKRFFINKLF